MKVLFISVIYNDKYFRVFPKVLMVSTSSIHGYEYLEYILQEVKTFFKGKK